MPTVTLLTGGARSGKSTYALKLADAYDRKTFIATAQAFDDEMRDRITRHKQERDHTYTTIEEPIDLAGAIAGLRDCKDFRDSRDTDIPHSEFRVPSSHDSVAIVDCLTVWVGNLMHHHGNLDAYPEIDALLDTLAAPTCDIILVTNEVGLGIIPDNPMTRRYRDLLGKLNQRIAAVADHVMLLVSGLPLTLK